MVRKMSMSQLKSQLRSLERDAKRAEHEIRRIQRKF